MFLNRFLKNTFVKGIVKFLPKVIWDKQCYSIIQQAGYQITPNGYYYPLPEFDKLNDDLWKKESELVGLDMNDYSELKLLDDIFPKYLNECQFSLEKTKVPNEFYMNNGSFADIDALILHSMIRHFKPQKIVEVGSGFSTYLSAKACLLNKEKDGINTELVAIEPYPNETLKKGFPGLSRLIQKPLEEIDLDLFTNLTANDKLFIDSTHVLKIGGDVKYEYLEILPRLKNGVIVHSHDIFLPFEYPKNWIMDQHWVWTEQYLLQAFLAFNNAFEVLWASQYMKHKYFDKVHALFGSHADYGAGSLWIRRKTGNVLTA